MEKPRVVIIGGGFGGLNAVKAMKNDNVEIFLIDKTNYHLFQPLLYQVATAALSPGDIAAPLRAILHNQKNVKVIMGEVKSIDKENRMIELNDEKIDFDYLVVAAGARHSYFGNEQWEKFAPGLKTISDALTLREKILLSFEKAERNFNKEDISKYMTFVIVGGGPTGVEMAGAIAEITKKTMLKDFKNINTSDTRIILVEAADRILTPYDPSLSEKAKKSLEELGVEVKLNTMVTDVNESRVKFKNDSIITKNIIWAAGNVASPLLKSLNVEQDKAGRVKVKKDCSIEGSENIFVIGDAALFIGEDNKPLPGVAPVAIQQGKYVAGIIGKQIPAEKRKPFHYFDKGSMATIGRAKAIMQLGKLKLSGFLAWLGWTFVHILYLIGFRNRYKVLAEWAWYYVSYRQGVRLITHKSDVQ